MSDFALGIGTVSRPVGAQQPEVGDAAFPHQFQDPARIDRSRGLACADHQHPNRPVPPGVGRGNHDSGPAFGRHSIRSGYG
ncbi:hypothetical protein SDC9_140759 [bioreactor metagenome]|uniref:Uncharacterized protein n=1 Tax=bioreactor metagenome TaxID=1076179 RepID=A0A645DWF4_9ZZZZ